MVIIENSHNQSNSISPQVFQSWTFQIPIQIAVAVLILLYREVFLGFQAAHPWQGHFSPMWSPTTNLGHLCDWEWEMEKLTPSLKCISKITRANFSLIGFRFFFLLFSLVFWQIWKHGQTPSLDWGPTFRWPKLGTVKPVQSLGILELWSKV